MVDQNPNEQLGLKSLKQMQRKQLGEKLKEHASLDWVFEKWYEKIILVIIGLAGLWKIWGLIFN